MMSYEKIDDYVCKVATKAELERRWEYLIRVHPGDDKWIKFRDNTIKKFKNGCIIPYLGVLNGEIICEATAYITKEAFDNDISDSSGLLDDKMCYLAAFRTNKECEGKGYFSKLYRFLEQDLKSRGYTELSLGVSPEEARNMEIYFHLGFREYIKTVIEPGQSGEVIRFYKKRIV